MADHSDVTEGALRVEDREAEVVDVLGVGFGPSNVAMAVALHELDTSERLRVRFVEQKPEFVWHSGMLIEGARAQVPFFKDLVTLRNPTSYFSYLNWLQQVGQLFRFITARDFTPFREELDAYFRWVAGHFDEQVDYGHRVTAIRLAGEDAPPGAAIAATVERLSDGRARTVFARDVVLATGGRPWVPPCARVDSPRVFHTHEYLPAVERVAPDPSAPHHFTVVGAGQSAGDTVTHLLDTYPGARVTLAFRGYAPRPLDESPFVNELFGTEARDMLLRDSPDGQARFLADHHFANYSAMDAELLDDLYRRRLRDALRGRERLQLLPYHEEWAELDSSGEVHVDESYRVPTRPEVRAGVYLQGFAERSHGLSETLLSLLPVRSGDIASSLLARHADVLETSNAD